MTPPVVVSKQLKQEETNARDSSVVEKKTDYAMGHLSHVNMKNPFSLKPENNLLFPESNQTDIEILGESIGKISESFERVFGDARDEAKIVESVFISDLQKTLSDRKAELRNVEEELSLSPQEK